MSTKIVYRTERYAPLQDLIVRNEGGRRIVDAYAAVFNTEQEIVDNEGHYYETIDNTAFNRTLSARAGRFQCIFNHGKTMHGTPSERFSMPLGKPLEIRPDTNGLFTSTEYANTDLAQEVVELMDTGAIRGMSFSGAVINTDRSRPQKNGLRCLHRMEIALREYGPTPSPAYQDARVLAVRHEVEQFLTALEPAELAEYLRSLSPEANSELVAALTATDTTTAGESRAASDGLGESTATTVVIPRPSEVLQTLANLRNSDKWSAMN